MSSPATTAKDALYHLYIGSEWTGPYQLEEVRALLARGEVQNDTFAYEPAQERHFLVEALLAENAQASAASSAATSLPGITLNSAFFDDSLALPPAQAAQEFPLVIPELRSMYQAFLGLTEGRNGDLHDLAQQLRKAQQRVSDALAARQSNTVELYALVNQIDEVADYLANRHQIPELWQLISAMEKVDLASETAHGIACANAVLTCLVDRAERHEPAVVPNGGLGMLLDVDDQDEHDSVATRKILLSARHEMHNAKLDVNALKEAYSQLETSHHHDIAEAQRLLAAAERARSDEHQGSEQAMAELRALAAEIHRLASEADVVGGADAVLLADVANLGSELASTDPSTLAYLAEDVLIRMVARLRQLVQAPEDVGPLRAELARARGELSQAVAIAAERDELKRVYQEQCRTAERANAQARDREHRLRSMVTALEVTKELHQEVMGDLQGELRSAQTRVESMERELAAVRGEIRGSSTSKDERSQELRDEMQRMVEMRSMLEVRREELAHHLETAEAELAKAQADPAADGAATAALNGKIIQLRQTFEVTQKRLTDQHELALRIESEISTSSNEAKELHGRSDDLSRELDEARSSLSVAKKRVEELHTAYGRLENERGALQQELASRKSTDTIRKISAGEQVESGTARYDKLAEELAAATKQAEGLEHACAAERHKVISLAEAQVDAQMRIEELTTERGKLRGESAELQSERSADHVRQASALALSIRASIESESRLKEALAQITTLESRLAGTAEAPAAGARPELEAELAQAHLKLAAATRALAEAHAERDALADKLRPDTLTGSADAALNAAVATRDELHVKLMQTIGERDRLRRDFDRLRNEHEAAAVEHRTALKSARDRLSEEQVRSAELEGLLAAERLPQGEAPPEQLRAQLADSLKEQARLRDDLQRHAQQIERLNSGRPSDRDSNLIELARATQQLGSEQERVQALTRSLVEALHAGETARSRGVDLQAKLVGQNAEREQYQLECERLRSALAELRVQGLDGGAEAKTQRATQEERKQTLAELERVTAELAELRQRIATGEHQELALDRLGAEQARIRTLEQQLSEAKADQLKNEHMFSEARRRLVQVSSERDRLAAEVEALKAKPDYDTELRAMRRRLQRARQRIRDLRAERDQAIQGRETHATNMHALTGQIDRLRANQRAAAEALGLAPPTAGFESRSALPVEIGSTSRLGAALQPLIQGAGDFSSSQRGVPRALTRRVVGVETASAGGFTSVFGRPSIPHLHPLAGTPVAGASAPATPLGTRVAGAATAATTAVGQHPQTRVIHASSLAATPRQSMSSGRAAVRGFWRIGLTATALAAAALIVLPPLVPYSADGVVNANVEAIKSPIEGRLTLASHNRGDAIGRAEAVATIRNDQVDTSARDALVALRRIAQEQLRENQTGLAAKELFEATLVEQAARQRETFIEALEARLFALTSPGEAHPPTGSPPSSGAGESVGDELARIKHGLEEARHGTFPPAASLEANRLEEARKDIAILKDEITAGTQGISTLDAQVASAEVQLAARREATVASPVSGTVWRQQGTEGKWVKGGEMLMLIANPATAWVEAAISERYYSQIAIGDQIEIRLLGEQRTVYGTVRAPLLAFDAGVTGQACPLTSGQPGRSRLLIELDEGSARSLTVGGHAEVLDLGQHPGLARRLLCWLYEKTRL